MNPAYNLKTVIAVLAANLVLLAQLFWVWENWPDAGWPLRVFAAPLLAFGLAYWGLSRWGGGKVSRPGPWLKNIAPALSGRKSLAALCLLFFLCFYLLNMGGSFYSSDDMHRYYTVKSLVDQKKLAIRYPPQNKPHYSKYGIVQPLLTIPLYSLGKAFKADEAGFRKFDEAVSSTLMQIISAVICMVMFLFLVDYGYPPGKAMTAVFIYGLATMAFPHAKLYFTEPLSALSLLLTVWQLMRFRKTGEKRALFWAGLSLGIGGVNKTLLFVLPTPCVGAYLIWLLWPREGGACRTWGQALNAAAWFLAPMAVCAAFVLWFNDFRYGSPFRTGYEHDGGRPTPIHKGGGGFSADYFLGLYGLLFSAGKSVFLYNPPLILALASARRFVARCRPEGLLALGLALIWLVVYGKWWSWHGGWCWGPRHLFPVICLASLPLAQVAADFREKWLGYKIGAGLIVAAGLVVQVIGSLLPFSTYMVHSIGPKEIYFYRLLFLPNYSPILGNVATVPKVPHLEYFIFKYHLAIGPWLMALTAWLAQLTWLGTWASGHWRTADDARASKGRTRKQPGG